MVALSARTGGSRHTGLAALPHENNQKQSEMLYQGSMQKKEILLNAYISMMKRFVQWQSSKVLHIQL